MERFLEMIVLLAFSIYILLSHSLLGAEKMLVFLFVASGLILTFALPRRRKRLQIAACLLLCGGTVAVPSMFFLSPAMLYLTLTVFPGGAGLLLVGGVRFVLAYQDMGVKIAPIMGLLLALILFLVTEKYVYYKEAYLQSRDALSQKNLALSQKNRMLSQGIDQQVELAVLAERNRIAREIHDNVGHMLTRGILQLGAVEIINTQDGLREPLSQVKTTLDEAMTSIRQSVHRLYDDAIHLKSAAEDAVKPLAERFSVTFSYDVTEETTPEIKLCLLAILKESVSNILKHSRGNAVEIVMREHPGFYRLSVTDNGGGCEISPGGIGLLNMESRVRDRGGILEITPGRDSFRVYVTLPRSGNFVR